MNGYDVDIVQLTLLCPDCVWAIAQTARERARENEGGAQPSAAE